MNREVKAKIVLHYGSQAAAAPKLGMTERRLSRIIHGYDRPRPEEVIVMREKLGVDLREPPEPRPG